jgi:NAD(P)-dependent dehydrogenase (short-subunit alcohol dehydrogenase family)
VDLFFNNAGIGVGGDMDTYAPPDWDDVFDVNLRGVAYGVQCVYPVMIRQGSGHIVNTASVAGLVTSPGSGSYTATKHAVVGLSKALRVEGRRHGVRISALCPGAIATPILTGGVFGRVNIPVSKEKLRALWERTHPMDPDVFASKVLPAVARNEGIIVVPQWWKALWYLERVSPALSAGLWERLYANTRAQIAAARISESKHEAEPDPSIAKGANGRSAART